jgi:fungal STAND N-terminal Goodbye domain
MSSTGQAASSSSTPSIPSHFQLIINAVADYAKQTGIDLAKNPFAEKIELSNSPEAILELLQEREKAFKEYREGNRRLITCLTPAVTVLHAFSGILGEAVSLVSGVTYYPLNPLTWPRQVPFSPAKAVFTGIDVLLAVRPLNTLFNQVSSDGKLCRLPVGSARATTLFLNSLNAWGIFSSVSIYIRRSRPQPR